ncbi:MAG: class I mannose-6-phosphate isomerase, partial [Treponema sp.]|nr:class I mannose-6-phosphate isomerase [Treponema sp.]
MFKLTPIQSDKVWGYELWIASTHPNGCQADFMQATGGYPLLVKIIQANDTLSVQVHPDDAKAVELEGVGSRGKTECWYVLDAKPEAKLVYGLNGTYSEAELRAAISETRLEDCLNTVEVHKGDFIFIPAGTVHAIGGGLRLLEVQQSCDITYRLYDWGRPREIHVEKGLQSIKNATPEEIKPLGAQFDCDYFTLKHMTVKGGCSWLVPASSNPSDWQLVYITATSGMGASIRATAPDAAASGSDA